MKRSVSIAVLCLMAMWYSSCSSPEAADEAKGFRIVAVEDDTLYVEESTWMKIGETLPDASRLKLFLGTTPCAIERVDGQLLYFNIPDFVDNIARYRLYKDDTLLATGSPEISVMHLNATNFTRNGLIFGDHYGRTGDVISIASSASMPRRDRDFEVWVDNEPMKIIHHDLRSVQFRIGEHTRDGAIRVRLLKNDTVVGSFRRLPTMGEFLPSKSIDSFSLLARWMNLVIPNDRSEMADTLVDDVRMPYFQTPYALVQPMASTYSVDRDTMVLTIRGTGAQDNAVLTMRLKLDNERHSASGMIDVYRSSQPGTSGINLRMQDVPWRVEKDGSYILFLEGFGFTEHFVEARYSSFREIGLKPGRYIPLPDATLRIRLVPRR